MHRVPHSRLFSFGVRKPFNRQLAHLAVFVFNFDVHPPVAHSLIGNLVVVVEPAHDSLHPLRGGPLERIALGRHGLDPRPLAEQHFPPVEQSCRLRQGLGRIQGFGAEAQNPPECQVQVSVAGAA